LLWRVLTEEKILYLTFDDGPVPGPTEFVLEHLEKYNAKATFFCIGDNVRKHPTIFDKVLGGGHAIGNHTFNHLKGWSTSNQRYIENINQCSAQFTAHKAQPVKHFRPPYGRITNGQIKILKNKFQIVKKITVFTALKSCFIYLLCFSAFPCSPSTSPNEKKQK